MIPGRPPESPAAVPFYARSNLDHSDERPVLTIYTASPAVPRCQDLGEIHMPTLVRFVPWVIAAALLLGVPSTLRADTSPNDPAWPTEWGPVLTHTDQVWARGTGSPRVVVAVVDTGVAPVADLAGALVPGVDFVGGGVSQGGAEEKGYHGTWVASIIAARGDNKRDTAGYCWQCSIMPVRVSNGTDVADDKRVAAGIRWAVDHGARIVNVSLAGTDASSAEEDAITYAAEHGVLVVASAGNSGDETRHYPGAFSSVLSVAGTDQQDALYEWSTRGQWVDLAAPGCATVVDPNVGAAYGCGSSYAPAEVAGIAALLLSFDPSLSTEKIVAALRSTAHPVAGIGGGRVDAAAAFTALGLGDLTSPPPQVTTTAPAVARSAGLETTDLRGSLSGTRSFPLETGPGRVVVRVRVRPPVVCELRVRLASSVLVATTVRGAATLVEVAPSGPLRVVVACPQGRKVSYTLTVQRPARD